MTSADLIALIFGALAVFIAATMFAAYFYTPEFVVPVLLIN